MFKNDVLIETQKIIPSYNYDLKIRKYTTCIMV